MAELNDWNIAAASNNSTPPDGWPENMAYSEVNNSAREGMAVLKRYFADINGSLAGAGVADAYTVTLNAGYLAYFEGMYFVCSINADNTGASTINVNGIGAQSIVNRDGSALSAGSLQSGGLYEFRYDGTNFQLMGTVAGSILVANGYDLVADINTATPPTTEAVTAVFRAYDAEGVDLLCAMGFNGSNALQLRNYMHGGNVQLYAEDASGTGVTLIDADPDNIQVILPQNNDVANPTLAFGDGDSGWYESADDTLVLVVGGETAMTVALNGALTGYYNNETQFRTAHNDASDAASGLEVKGPDGTFRYVGFNIIPTDSALDSGNDTVAQTEIGEEYAYDSATARTLNLNNDATIPVDAVWAYYVGPSAGTLTAQAGAGVTIEYWDGSAWQTTAVAGSVTLGEGQGTIKKISDTYYRINGANIS